MATSNRDRVARVMDLLKEGLGPFVLREYKMVYKGSGYAREIDDALRTSAYELPRGVVLDPQNIDETLIRWSASRLRSLSCAASSSAIGCRFSGVMT
jgi:hypothetical protein